MVVITAKAYKNAKANTITVKKKRILLGTNDCCSEWVKIKKYTRLIKKRNLWYV